MIKYVWNFVWFLKYYSLFCFLFFFLRVTSSLPAPLCSKYTKEETLTIWLWVVFMCILSSLQDLLLRMRGTTERCQHMALAGGNTCCPKKWWVILHRVTELPIWSDAWECVVLQWFCCALLCCSGIVVLRCVRTLLSVDLCVWNNTHPKNMNLLEKKWCFKSLWITSMKCFEKRYRETKLQNVTWLGLACYFNTLRFFCVSSCYTLVCVAALHGKCWKSDRPVLFSAQEEAGQASDEAHPGIHRHGVRLSERQGVELRHDGGGALLPVHPQPLQPARRQGVGKVWNSIKSISLALNHTHRLKGLNRPYMYETPPDPSPPEGKRKPPSSARKRSRGGTQSGGSLLQGMIRSAKGAIIGVHTCIHTFIRT